MTKIDRLYNRLTAAGLTARKIELLNADGTKRPALDIDTSYEGPYPTRESLQKLEKAEKICQRLTCQIRGHYVALFVW